MQEEDVIKGHPLLIYYNDQPQYYLSPGLAEAKGILTFVNSDWGEGFKIESVDVARLEELKELHHQKLDIFAAMEATDVVEELKAYASTFEKIEFMLQEVWGFEPDKNFHEWWSVPKCSCPKMDNKERQGTPFGIVSGGCPIHGGEVHD